MVVEAWRAGRVPAESEQPALAAMASDLAPLFVTAVPSERRALYVISANAGFASSVAFWSGAAREGVAYASPALFPWTLSNAPCGWLAREFGVRGPNVTYTGRSEALGAALHQCRRDLDDQQADVGWIVAIDFRAAPHRSTGYAAMRVTLGTGAMVVERGLPSVSASRLRASTALARVLTAASRKGCSGFSDGHTAWTLRTSATSRSARRARPTRPSRP